MVIGLLETKSLEAHNNTNKHIIVWDHTMFLCVYFGLCYMDPSFCLKYPCRCVQHPYPLIAMIFAGKNIKLARKTIFLDSDGHEMAKTYYS